MENFKSIKSKQNGTMNPYVPTPQVQQFKILPFLYHHLWVHPLPTPTCYFFLMEVFR